MVLYFRVRSFVFLNNFLWLPPLWRPRQKLLWQKLPWGSIKDDGAAITVSSTSCLSGETTWFYGVDAGNLHYMRCQSFSLTPRCQSVEHDTTGNEELGRDVPKPVWVVDAILTDKEIMQQIGNRDLSVVVLSGPFRHDVHALVRDAVRLCISKHPQGTG